MRLCLSYSLIQPTGLLQMGGFKYTFPLLSSVKTPPLSVDSYLVLQQEAVSKAPVSPASCKRMPAGQHKPAKPSTATSAKASYKYRALWGFQAFNPQLRPTLSYPSLCGGEGCCGGEVGVRETGREREEQRTNLQIPPLFLCGEGWKGPWLSS